MRGVGSWYSALVFISSRVTTMPPERQLYSSVAACGAFRERSSFS
jgi:hypothetical protein